jgi:putative endonuclease
MAAVYILYSPNLGKFYTGSCKDYLIRIEQHLSEHFPGAFTSTAKDWFIYFVIENWGYTQARKIEAHIKRMKSRKYIEDLKKYPEMTKRLTDRYV